MRMLIAIMLLFSFVQAYAGTITVESNDKHSFILYDGEAHPKDPQMLENIIKSAKSRSDFSNVLYINTTGIDLELAYRVTQIIDKYNLSVTLAGKTDYVRPPSVSQISVIMLNGQLSGKVIPKTFADPIACEEHNQLNMFKTLKKGFTLTHNKSTDVSFAELKAENGPTIISYQCVLFSPLAEDI